MFLPLARSNNVVVQNLDREILIYDLTADKAFCLNETSATVYQACDGQTSFDELRREHKFTDDIIFFALDQLQDNLLIEDTRSDYFAGLSRREVIKKVGLATMITLPAIAAIVAPAAARAASVGGLFAACATSADCSRSAPNCAEGQGPNSPKRCCIGTDANTLGSGQLNNSCNSPVGGLCNSANFTCLSPEMRCCSGSGSVNCTTTGGETTCTCTCI